MILSKYASYSEYIYDLTRFVTIDHF